MLLLLVLRDVVSVHSIVSVHQSVKELFSASLLFSKPNRPPFYCWHNHDCHINTFMHFIHIVKQMHKMSEKYLQKKKISLKIFFVFPCIIFKVNCQLWGWEMPSCNITPYQWCVYWLLGLSEDLREGLKGPLLGCIDSLRLWLPVGLQSIQFRPPYKVRIVRRFLMLCRT